MYTFTHIYIPINFYRIWQELGTPRVYRGSQKYRRWFEYSKGPDNEGSRAHVGEPLYPLLSEGSEEPQWWLLQTCFPFNFYFRIYTHVWSQAKDDLNKCKQILFNQKI